MTTAEGAARKGEQTRNRMIAAASRLFQAQGYSATGLKQILQESGAPRGSLYFHFPGGKEELAEATVHVHGQMIAAQLDALFEQEPDPLRACRLMVHTLGDAFVAAQGRSGCPVFTVTREMAAVSDRLQAACRGVFEDWLSKFERALTADGDARPQAGRRARTLLGALEGAHVLSRAWGSRAPLDDLEAMLPALLGR